jgi:ABC-type sugar transport system ATPase subunit
MSRWSGKAGVTISATDTKVAASPQIELRGRAQAYGNVEAVSGVDLVVHRGEFFSLLGPSGCGKSTILKMIAGFEDADSGEILVAGRSMTGVPPERRNIGFVFQNYALFPHMSVAENIAFGLEARGLDRSPSRSASTRCSRWSSCRARSAPTGAAVRWSATARGARARSGDPAGCAAARRAARCARSQAAPGDAGQARRPAAAARRHDDFSSPTTRRKR